MAHTCTRMFTSLKWACASVLRKGKPCVGVTGPIFPAAVVHEIIVCLRFPTAEKYSASALFASLEVSLRSLAPFPRLASASERPLRSP